MARATEINNATPPGNPNQDRLFGIPLGELGLFSSLLIGTATGFIAFFAGTFLAIVGILVYNTATHGTVDFAYSYRRVGLPVGIATLVLSLSYLGTLWVKRKLRPA